ncbi:uncharacterized protein LOC134178016 [Corticium candelabrum]|uniref:uncharacterized protein LOC134178016 n=1 Tax=Corticium candelabrum TaxID=121492 RepID=UPI002E264770|nr:uncharacterized protein LOC134178016 [Corticium candelabrum]
MSTDGLGASGVTNFDDIIHYSNVWEDHALLETALDVNADDDVLSVASAGDNIFNLLLMEPRSLTAIDMSRAQIAVLELKMAAIRHLPSHGDFLTILGLQGKPEERVAVYNNLEPFLPLSCSNYFNYHPSVVVEGIVSSGLLEKLVAGYTRDVVSTAVSSSELDALFDEENVEEQARLFRSFPLDKMKQDFLEFFSYDRFVGSNRSEKELENVEDLDFSENLWFRLIHVITTIPARKNFYLSWLLRGPDVAHHTVPPYLHEKNFNRLRSLLDRVTVVTDTLENHLKQSNDPSSYNKINLSDVFEYRSEEDCHALFHLVVARCRPGGRLVYWDLFTPHRAPETLLESQLLKPVPGMEDRLHKKDRMFFYISFHVHAVKSGVFNEVDIC